MERVPPIWYKGLKPPLAPPDPRLFASVCVDWPNKFICYYDGSKKIEATDDTFKDAGKVGLWTKADSVTYFDDSKVTAK